MQTIDLDSWNDLPTTVEEIRTKVENYTSRRGVLFRGHSNEKWRLETTLERRGDKNISLYEYLVKAQKYVNEIESFTGHQFNTLKNCDLKSRLLKAKEQPDFFNFPSYEFAIYLRHHGFPSPLLDWSRSFYVAAFFAFQKPIAPEDKIAIFAYVERPEGTKFVYHQDSTIISLSPFTSAHKRHFSQQAEYTICAQWSEENGYIFRPHSDIFERDIESQDMLTKITLPGSQRTKALSFFQDANINKFTLFQTEDALISSIEARVFDIDNT